MRSRRPRRTSSCVARASVWRVDAKRTRIDCLDIFEAAGRSHTSGARIRAADAPCYFEAALTERCIVADDARIDPRTSEFTTHYLDPHGITSMLDAPIIVRGAVVGVICHEHVGPSRTWQPWEELAAATLTDVAGMASSAAEHAEQSRELETLRGNLEKLVHERTRELSESRENVRALFSASPVALILTRLADSTVLLANDRAGAMFQVDVAKIRGVAAADFWVKPEDRATMVDRLRTHGVLDGLDAELKASTGRQFWGNVSANIVLFEGERAVLVGVQDITEKKDAELSLRQNEEALRTMLEAAPLPLVVTGLDDAMLRFSNKRAADMFGTTIDELVGKRAPDFYENPADRQKFVEALRTTGRVDAFAARLRARDGRTFWALLSARTMVLRDARVFMVGFSDLTEQKEIEHTLRDLASTDGLTGIYNRRHFFETASAALALADVRGRSAGIAMLDVDHFERVNDVHGHAVGDEALRMLARVCQLECRSSDVLARYGGEEFVVLLPETTLQSANTVVERIRRALGGENIAAPSGAFVITNQRRHRGATARRDARSARRPRRSGALRSEACRARSRDRRLIHGLSRYTVTRTVRCTLTGRPAFVNTSNVCVHTVRSVVRARLLVIHEVFAVARELLEGCSNPLTPKEQDSAMKKIVVTGLLSLSLACAILVPETNAAATERQPLQIGTAVDLQCTNPGSSQDVAKTPIIKNTSGAMLKKDYLVWWRTNSGDKGYFRLSADLAPGATVKAQGAPGNAYSCTANILSRPDLVPVNAQWQGTTAVKVDVSNLDPWIAADSSTIRLEVMACSGQVLQTYDSAPLGFAKGEAKSVTFNAKYVPGKTYLRVTADATAKILELNEKNNVLDGASSCVW